VNEAGWFLALCLTGFWLLALGAFFGAIAELWSKCRRRPFLRPAVGEVFNVEVHSLNLPPDGSYDSDDRVYAPVVRFKTASGEVKTFKSPVSVGSPSKYKVGMTIPVLYDPDDVMPPMIDAWVTIWGFNVILFVFALVMLGAAAFFVYAVSVLHVLRGRI